MNKIDDLEQQIIEEMCADSFPELYDMKTLRNFYINLLKKYKEEIRKQTAKEIFEMLEKGLVHNFGYVYIILKEREYNEIKKQFLGGDENEQKQTGKL